jgi:hypothetical protein
MNPNIKEFLRKSNVDIQTTPSSQPSSVSTTSSVNNITRNIEASMLRNQRFPNNINKSIMSNDNYGEFAQFVYNSNDNTNSTPSMVGSLTTSPSTTNLVISKLNPGMFNATVNKHFTSGNRINLKNILSKKPKERTPIGGGLFIDTLEIKGIYGRFQTGFVHSRQYGAKGSLSKDYFSVQFNITVSDGNITKGASVNFYKNGKVRFSGGFLGTNIEQQPDLIRRYMVNTYSDKEAFLYNPFEYNNLSGQFRINGVFRDFYGLSQRFYKYGVESVNYESELSPFMYIQYKKHKYILAKTGNIQISGAAFPQDMIKAYNDGMELVRFLNTKNEIIITNEIPNSNIVQKKKKIKTSIPTHTKKIKPLTHKQQNAINVDEKKCLRMSKNELLHLARTIGVVGIKNTTKKEDICKKIKSITNKKSVVFRNTNKEKNTTLSGKNNKLKIGRSLCGNYSKTELIRISKILGITVNEKDTKQSLCKKIEKIKNMKILANSRPTPPPPPKPSRKNVVQKKKDEKRSLVIKRRRLDENSIRQDIQNLYGKRWINRYKNVMPSLNQDVKNIKSKINKLSHVDKAGIVFKKNADLIKRRMINRWKGEREKELERKVIIKQINVNGINPRLANRFRVAATNYIISRGPTKKQFNAYKKTWMNLQTK